MHYESTITRILKLVETGERIRLGIISNHEQGKIDLNHRTNRLQIIGEIKSAHSSWVDQCLDFLKNNLPIDFYKFKNFNHGSVQYLQFGSELAPTYTKLMNQINLLLDSAKNIKKNQEIRNIKEVFIEDIDNFKNIREIPEEDVKDYFESAFLEDDVKKGFCEAIGEHYIENDHGGELRDLFSSRIRINSKRISSAIMFKGRGVKDSLKISNCGSTGTQLLNLSKNTFAQLFIIQHVNKIEPEVKESIRDHLLIHSKFHETYLCFVDGVDTARFLKSIGKDLEELKNKKLQR